MFAHRNDTEFQIVFNGFPNHSIYSEANGQFVDHLQLILYYSHIHTYGTVQE